MWSNKKSYVGFFRIIGSEVIVLNKRGKRRKFYPKEDKYILVGYSSESKAYRLWRPKIKTVIKARDVRFIEDINSSEDTSFNPNVINQDPSSSPEDQRQKQEAENNGNCKEDNLRNDLQDDSQLDEEEADSQETSGEEDERQVEQNHHRSEETRRGRGRSKIIRTGQPGRPRKVYQRNTIISQDQDPCSVSEVIGRDDQQA